MNQLLRTLYENSPETLKKRLRRLKDSYPVQWIAWKFFQYPNPKWYINEHQLRPHYRNALQYLKNSPETEQIGDYLEFGVCHGSSMLLMYKELLAAEINQMRLFGFDSFEGLPEDDEDFWIQGSFMEPLDNVLKRFSKNKVDLRRVTFVKGFYRDTLNEKLKSKHGITKASLIMIDCDMYSSTVEALEFCEPLIKDEAILIFDDWNPLARENKGEKRAFDEFMNKYNHFAAEELGNYSYRPGDLHGKVFKISRTVA